MRGVPSTVTSIRKKVFTEVARLAYEGGDYTRMEKLPYVIAPGEIAAHRESIFLERAIAGERVRLAMGLPLRSVQEHSMLSDGVEESAIAEKYYDPPLINIINYACNACPTKQYRVTEFCQGCLAQNCHLACPKDAIDFQKGKAVINQDKCIKCGRCADACSYGSIIKLDRPCVQACGMDAIESDEFGRAVINQDKCVSCGMCLVNCPFGAIVDKGQVFQLIQSIKRGDQVIALVAPAFVGQFGPHSTPEKLTAGMKALGFHHVTEVAVGADLCTIEEAKDFLDKVPEQQPFMATSCCPAWYDMATKLYPEYAHCISMALTPMVLTARLEKKKYPGSKIVFIGPCAAKKLEASRANIRSDVDFVITFEELQGMFEAKDIKFEELEDGEPLLEGTGAGRGFAVAGGVAQAVADVIHRWHPEMEVKVAHAEGLRECRKLLTMARAGKYNGYLLEGMGCPGGCVGGAGTIRPINKSAELVARYKKEAPEQNALDSKYESVLPTLD
ncbi:4Fe-4S dicluster domain-containing protein [Candidatus Avoscillospira sp. LCP25S3_F1]|uniref:4Fe-4S dicluster domain-containing protein n=1 Tax=Candidatus Avoscillospira sp. LCP25S3_F1 TaxID=3438825 RepID=UPI003F939E81